MNNRNSFPLVLASLMAFCFSLVASGETAPCDLLTQNQIKAAVGGGAGAGVPINNTGCSWLAPGPPRVMVTVSLQSQQVFTGAKSAPNAMPVSGIGDEAVFSGVQNFASLWVKKGSTVLLVRVYGLPLSDAQTKLKNLAANAVSKL